MRQLQRDIVAHQRVSIPGLVDIRFQMFVSPGTVRVSETEMEATLTCFQVTCGGAGVLVDK